MIIVTVTGYKGGVGKSTTAVHIATFFSDLGKTIVVDGDPNRTALKWSKRGELPFTVADERQAMKQVSKHDYVVIDTPARPDSDDLNELAKGCDLLILPTAPDVVSLEPMLETANDLKDGTSYRTLLTIVPPYPSKEGDLMKADLKEAQIPVFETMIRRTAGFQKAAFQGVPISEVSAHKVAWFDYERLGDEIMEIVS